MFLVSVRFLNRSSVGVTLQDYPSYRASVDNILSTQDFRDTCALQTFLDFVLGALFTAVESDNQLTLFLLYVYVYVAGNLS